MVDVAEVEAVLADVLGRFEDVDAEYRRAVLPSSRMVELVLTDLDMAYHALLDHGSFGPVQHGHAPARAGIRISATSETLLAIVGQRLAFGEAYATGRLRLEASFVDLLRLRALL